MNGLFVSSGKEASIHVVKDAIMNCHNHNETQSLISYLAFKRRFLFLFYLLNLECNMSTNVDLKPFDDMVCSFKTLGAMVDDTYPLLGRNWR